MIETSLLLGYFTPLIFISMAAAMVVLRAGASRIFFDIVGTMQVNKLIKDSKASATIIEALYVDALVGVMEGVGELGEGFVALMDDIIPIGREIGEAQRQFEKFVNTGEDLGALNAEIIEIGHGFGFAADESFEAAAKMAQLAGVLGQGSTATGTEMGMAFGLISGMDTESAMQRMVNLNQQTGFMTKGIDENSTAAQRNNAIRENTMRILDQLNTVENTSAATMSQITFVMNQFASQAYLTGESLAGMAAMSAVLIEAGEEQGKGGRAIRTVYARLGADTNGARREIEKLGIAVIDQETGAMRPLTEILNDVSVKYQGMTGEQKSNLAQTVAGNLHYTRLIKLLEGTTRMQELQTDALEGTFPAYEEIERLQDTNLFQLEQMEARLKSTKGALADELMPAVTHSTELMLVFNDTLLQVSQMKGIGGIFKGLFAGAETLKTIAPFVTTIVSVMNLRIALEALNHVKRAMNGEDMFRLQTSNAANAAQAAETGFVKGTVIPTTKEQIQATKDQIQRYQELADRLRAAEDGEKKYAQALKQTDDLINRHKMNLMGKDAVAKQEMENQQLSTNIMNGYSMSLVGAGSALMLFSGNQKAMRAGMLLNTFAMAIQITKMGMSTVAKIKDSLATVQNNIVEGQAIITKNLSGTASLYLAAQNAILAAGYSRLAATTALTLGPLLALVGVAVLLTTVFSDVNKEIKDMSALSSIAEAAEIASDMTTDQITTAIAEQDKIINDYKDGTSDVSKALVADARQSKADLEGALDFSILTTTDSDELNRMVGFMDDLGIVMDDFKTFGGINPITGEVGKGDFFEMLKGGTDMDDYFEGVDARNALEKLSEQDMQILHVLYRNSLNSSAEIESFTETMIGSAEDSATAAIDSVNNVTQAGIDNLYEFNNAREELFYGFSSSNLTGDLIRQVQQQGVENLITNTELIVTNNFNGMTLPEMVDTITEEISSRLNLTVSGI